MVRLLAPLLAAGILAGCAAAPLDSFSAPTPLPAQPQCRAYGEPGALCVVVLGDSIAAGVPLGGGDRWWVQLQSLLEAAVPGRAVSVESWAVPGSMVDVLESAAREQAALDSFDAAIVIEGVNDEGRLALDVWLARYEAAVAAMQRKGLLVIVGTPPPGFESGAFTSRYDATAAAIRKVAAGQRCPILDVAKRWREDGAAAAAAYYADLIHQAAPGQRIIAEMASELVIRGTGR